MTNMTEKRATSYGLMRRVLKAGTALAIAGCPNSGSALRMPSGKAYQTHLDNEEKRKKEVARKKAELAAEQKQETAERLEKERQERLSCLKVPIHFGGNTYEEIKDGRNDIEQIKTQPGPKFLSLLSKSSDSEKKGDSMPNFIKAIEKTLSSFFSGKAPKADMKKNYREGDSSWTGNFDLGLEIGGV